MLTELGICRQRVEEEVGRRRLGDLEIGLRLSEEERRQPVAIVSREPAEEFAPHELPKQRIIDAVHGPQNFVEILDALPEFLDRLAGALVNRVLKARPFSALRWISGKPGETLDRKLRSSWMI